jgi:hypothetical protein
MLAAGPSGILLLRTLSHFVLTMIPCFAAASFAAWRGARDHVLLGLTGLAGIAANGYLAFWLWFLSPPIGHAVSFLLPIFGIAWLLWIGRKLNASARAALKSLALPAALVLCAALLVLSAGFAYGGIDRPLETPWTRFSHRLPPDNMLPFLFAEEVRIGRFYKPFFEGGHSSDRPPLQAGIALSQYPFLPRPRELGYTALGVVLQSLWIYAMWLFLRAFDLPPRMVLLALAVALFSGFVFVNSFFVWPKLLAAAFMIGFCSLILVDKFAFALARSVPLMFAAGALLSFGMLAHGGSAFALIGLIAAAIVLRRRLPLKSLGIICAGSFLIYLPWLLYQRLFDPPGDALLKLHLAGIDHPDNGPLLQELIAAYSRLTPAMILHNKTANAVWVFDYEREYWSRAIGMFSALGRRDRTQAARSAQDLRSLAFFHFVPTLGFLVTGAVALAAGLNRRFRSSAWRVAARLWLLVLCTLVPWCLIMFKAEATSIHQGTYVTVLLAFSASILALWAVTPWLALVVAALQIGLNFLLYGVLMGESAGAVPSPDVLLYGQLGLFVVALVCLVSLTWRHGLSGNLRSKVSR